MEIIYDKILEIIKDSDNSFQKINRKEVIKKICFTRIKKEMAVILLNDLEEKGKISQSKDFIIINER